MSSERDVDVVDFTARLLAGLVRHGSLETVRRALPEALPWVTFLPEPDVEQLLHELVVVAQGAASLKNLARCRCSSPSGGTPRRYTPIRCCWRS